MLGTSLYQHLLKVKNPNLTALPIKVFPDLTLSSIPTIMDLTAVPLYRIIYSIWNLFLSFLLLGNALIVQKKNYWFTMSLLDKRYSKTQYYPSIYAS